MFNGICHFGNWGSLGNYGAWGWLGMTLNMVFWLGLLVGLSALVVWAIRRVQIPGATISHTTRQLTAKEILQARYAHGEITRDQYQQMLDDLE